LFSSSSTQAGLSPSKLLEPVSLPSKDDPVSIKTSKPTSTTVIKSITAICKDTAPGEPGHTATDTSTDLSIIRLLMERIAKLQEERVARPATKAQEPESSKIQIIYHVNCHDNKSTAQFLDEPLEYGDGSDQTFHLHGQKTFPSDQISLLNAKGEHLCWNQCTLESPSLGSLTLFRGDYKLTSDTIRYLIIRTIYVNMEVPCRYF